MSNQPAPAEDNRNRLSSFHGSVSAGAGIPSSIKNCGGCGKDKPLSEYHRDSTKGDGRCTRCKECRRAHRKQRYPGMSERMRVNAALWYYKNRDRVIARKNERYRSDPQFRLATILRKRMYGAIRRGSRAGSAVADLGCSIAELRSHLEEQFEPGMTWKNQGEWHIDHINPLSSFDLADREQYLEACHYTNLQPMWASDNWRKGAKQKEEAA